MNEQDLRDCFAMFAMLGLIMADQGEVSKGTAISAYEIADQMLEARKAEPEQEVGIVAAKSRRKAKDA